MPNFDPNEVDRRLIQLRIDLDNIKPKLEILNNKIIKNSNSAAQSGNIVNKPSQNTIVQTIYRGSNTQPTYPICEVPNGTIDGSNTLFKTTKNILTTPKPILILNNLVQDPLNTTPDFIIQNNNEILYNIAPEADSKHVIWYWPGLLSFDLSGGGGSFTLFDNLSEFNGADAFTTINNTGDMVAGSFTASSNCNLSSLKICIGNGDIFGAVNHAYTIDVAIYNDSAGSPGTLNTDFGNLTTASITPGNDIVVNVTVSPVALIAGTRYWIVITMVSTSGTFCYSGFASDALGTGVPGEFWGTNISGAGWTINSNSALDPPQLMQVIGV